MLDNWHRIERIVKWTGLSVNAFAHTIGLNRAENLYQIKKGNNGISRELADNITAKYPTISKAWLLAGEGEMLNKVEQLSSSDIPVFETEVSKYLTYRTTMTPAYYISMPMFKGSDFAAVSMSDSMAPEIPSASTVLFKKVTSDDIVPGKAYYVSCPQFGGIRFIRREIGSATLRLVPCNTDKYDEIATEVDQIDELFLVKGVIIDKTI